MRERGQLNETFSLITKSPFLSSKEDKPRLVSSVMSAQPLPRQGRNQGEDGSILLADSVMQASIFGRGETNKQNSNARFLMMNS